MKKSFTLFLLAFPLFIYAQQNLKDIRKKSYETFVYKIAADSAEKYILKDSIPIDLYLNQPPYKIFARDSVNEDELSPGQYLLLNVNDNDIIADIIGVSNVYAYPVNNQHQVQLSLRNKEGASITNAEVFADGKAAEYNDQSETFIVKQKNPDEAFVKIYTPGDTTFLLLSGEYENDKTALHQRLSNFKYTRTGAVVLWLPQKIKSVFKSKRYRSYVSNYTGAKGYMVFNQPKYKLTDTVKFKAYIVDKKQKRYRKDAEVFLEYYKNGRSQSQFLSVLQPTSPGSFVYAFPLSDTLSNDIKYNLILKTKKHKQLVRGSFSTEDYVLDEVAKYNFRSSKEEYYQQDSLVFFATANDANGLSLLDARAKLVLTRGSVHSFNKDTLYVPDTLYAEEKPMLTDGETKFVVHTNSFPFASMEINAELIFRNSNNELHTESSNIEYKTNNKELYTAVINDTVIAEYRENGKAVAAKGMVEIYGDPDADKQITFPFRIKVDPFAEEYEFYLLENNRRIDSSFIEIENTYDVNISRISIKDSFGFALNNPYKIPVWFSVFDGNKIIASGRSEEAIIKWLQSATHKNRGYKVKWQYVWANEPYEKQESIALLYKVLDIKINAIPVIYPGQKDSITVEVKDYKGRPAEGVNLTAVGYNSQFKKNIKVPEPPYLQRYHTKPSLQYDKFEWDDAYIIKKYKIGYHTAAIKKFGLDTMLYYKMLFPENGFYDATATIHDFIPQVSVHVVKKGIPQEIYLLYINRELVYYNGVTDKSNYVFPAFEGYSQIAFRLADKYIQVDSIYLQPSYKHDIVFDLDHLPAKALVQDMPITYTYKERNLLEKSIWQLDNNVRTTDGYIWQGLKVVKLSGNGRHLAGPFRNLDSMHFFAPNDFDIHFRFEPGYEYNLSKQIERLEKKTIFPDYIKEIKLPFIENTVWILGDTLVSPPQIKYEPAVVKPFIKLSSFNNLFSGNENGIGALQFTTHKDSMLTYVILCSADTADKCYIANGSTSYFSNITPGRYNLMLVTNHFYTVEYNNLLIKNNQLLCVDSGNVKFVNNHPFISKLIEKSMHPPVPIFEKEVRPLNIENLNDKDEVITSYENLSLTATGKSAIQGKVIDKKGKLPIPFGTVLIKGTKTVIASNAEGNFIFNNIKQGTYTLVVSAVGYQTSEVTIQAEKGTIAIVNISLQVTTQALNDVVVTAALGISRQSKSLGYSITSIQGNSLLQSINVTAALQGRAAGLMISGDPGASSQITIRGVSSLTGNNKPLFVIDGILYDELPANINPDMLVDITVLKDAEATAIYGSRAANGVILISTNSKSVRTQFRDYAFWQPELFTDKNGKAKFAVEYPDNITGWEAYILAMDKHLRIGKAATFIKSYKPVMAQLSMPQFLLLGDSVQLIGKCMNYSDDAYNLSTKFSINDKLVKEDTKQLSAKESVITALPVVANNNTDTLKAAYTLQTTTGFKDGEERKIPVFKTGTEETVGKFWVLQQDTAFTFSADENAGAIELSAQNNTLDILLDEIEHLKKYPYYCMEQTASKLRGLLMEKKIKESLKQKFDNDKQVQQLLQKIQKSQLFDGGWAWWESGKPDLYITNYIIQALLPLRDDATIESNIRNGLLYLQNQLTGLNKDVLLTILATMSTAHHLIDYTPWLAKINFDSLTLHQQWQYVQIRQNLNLPHQNEMEKLISKSTPGMLGSTHWGEENYNWHSNANATTLLAYNVLKNENDKQEILTHITQYFLEQRSKGYWANTVESASIVSAILPEILKQNLSFTKPASLQINGDTSLTVNTFPYQIKTNNKSIKQLTIVKSGGGLTYFSIFQQLWNPQPQAITGNFNIRSHFEKNGITVNNIQSGEQIKMIIDADVKKDADYVMIEIPIPAGCIYASKNQDSYEVHKEFLKNKVILFAISLNKGIHHFEINLEPRYTGSFTLNPVKAALMYFPVFFGQNEMSRILIK